MVTKIGTIAKSQRRLEERACGGDGAMVGIDKRVRYTPQSGQALWRPVMIAPHHGQMIAMISRETPFLAAPEDNPSDLLVNFKK